MKINGTELISISYSKDIRGSSQRIYDAESIGDFLCDEIFISTSEKDVIRGMHFQEYPYSQKKLITVLEGSIEGVILDLRKTSTTYLEIECVKINEKSRVSLLIPELCAWGFRTLADKNIVLYNISGKYKKEFDRGVNWNSIGYDWGIEIPILSPRDKELITLDEYIRRKKDGKTHV